MISLFCLYFTLVIAPGFGVGEDHNVPTAPIEGMTLAEWDAAMCRG